MGQILLVSKPVAPPWNDSSKNLVHDLARTLSRHEPIVLGRRGSDLSLPRGHVEPVYPVGPSAGFAPALVDLVDKARVLRRLLAGARGDLWHFFFAPNVKSSSAGALATRMRRVPSVQTICSAPAPGGAPGVLYFADRIVVLSRHTETRLLEEGIAPDRVRWIAPCIAPLEPMRATDRRQARARFELPQTAPVVVFPGDLEFGGGAEVVLEAFPRLSAKDAWLVMACRAKTVRARDAEASLRRRARDLGIDPRTRWVGETPAIHALLGAADVVALPSGSLFAKMDYPLVLLEAMSLGRAVVVREGTSAAELAEGGAAVPVGPGVELLAAELERLLSDEALRARVGGLARRKVLEEHGLAAMACSYETLYDELLV